MTAPGLALFYGGLVRRKNVLSVMMQFIFLMGLMTVIWATYGYSLAFGGDGGWIGNGDYLLMSGVQRELQQTRGPPAPLEGPSPSPPIFDLCFSSVTIIICLFGGILLTEFDNIQVRIGDSIAVVNALFWAFHIVFISRFLKVFNFPITIACVQCLIASLFALLPALVFENVELSNMILDGKEMIYAGVLSSGVAFLLQIYGQQNLAPAPVAIIFSLEGVFASIFGWIILSQYLNEIKIVGIVLILFAVIFSQLAPLYDKKKYGRN